MSGLKRLGLENCDEWFRATSVTSKSAVKTIGVVVEDFENVIKETNAVKFPLFTIHESKWAIKICSEGYNDSKTTSGEPLADKGFIGIWIFNENSEIYSKDKEKTFELEGKVTCCGKNFILSMPGSKQSKVFKVCGGYGWRNKLSHDQCTKNLIDGKLVVKAELSLVKRGDLKVSGGNEEGSGSESNENFSTKLIEKIYSEKVFCDFKLVSNDLEFDCHKTFIASQSETLRNAVERWAPDGKMILNEFKPGVIEVLINFFYSDRSILRFSLKMP